MKVLLMRHGVTAANLKKLYNGRTDDSLCPEGVEAAISSGIDPGIKSLYASPMKRALETARIKFPNAEITICHDLREMDFGDFEGRCYEELKNDADYITWMESGGTATCPNGENMSGFAERVCRAFNALVAESIEKGASELTVVAHGGTIMAIMSQYGRPEQPYYKWYVDNCCGYRANLDETDWAQTPVFTDCELYETL